MHRTKLKVVETGKKPFVPHWFKHRQKCANRNFVLVLNDVLVGMDRLFRTMMMMMRILMILMMMTSQQFELSRELPSLDGSMTCLSSTPASLQFLICMC